MPDHARDCFCHRCGTALQPREEGGRRRPVCPACGLVVFGRFSLGVGGLLTDDGRVLLVQRAHDPGRGRWTLPGGYVEEDEAPAAAIVREVREETGLTVGVGGLLAIRHAQTAAEQNAYHVFRLRLDGPADALRADGVETAQVRWVRPAELDALGEIGGISRWAIRTLLHTAPALESLPADALPPPVPGQRWVAVYAPPAHPDAAG